MNRMRKNDYRFADRVTGELVFFYLICANDGAVQEYELRKCFPYRSRTYLRYARELEAVGALPRVHVKRALGEACFYCDLEDFTPRITPDHADARLRRLSRLVCIAAERCVWHTRSYPDYRSLYTDRERRTLQRDRRTVFDALCWWAAREYEYDPASENGNWEFYEYVWYLEYTYGVKSHLLPRGFDPEN